MIDVGTVWGDNVDLARLRLPAMKRCRVGWIEEPFVSGALESYSTLANEAGDIPLAGGEGCHNFYDAKNHGRPRQARLFANRYRSEWEGITTTKQLVDYAQTQNVRFVNHTFTSKLALSASLQPYAGIESDHLCEYPIAASTLANKMTLTSMEPDANGLLHLPDAPGLGLEPDPEIIRKYQVDVYIEVGGKTIHQSPTIDQDEHGDSPSVDQAGHTPSRMLRHDTPTSQR